MRFVVQGLPPMTGGLVTTLILVLCPLILELKQLAVQDVYCDHSDTWKTRNTKYPLKEINNYNNNCGFLYSDYVCQT